MCFKRLCVQLHDINYMYFAFLGPGPCTDLADVQLVIEFVLLYTEQIITCNNPILKYIHMYVQDENQFK
jgi:hypothetical protein